MTAVPPEVTWRHPFRNLMRAILGSSKRAALRLGKEKGLKGERNKGILSTGGRQSNGCFA